MRLLLMRSPPPGGYGGGRNARSTVRCTTHNRVVPRVRAARPHNFRCSSFAITPRLAAGTMSGHEELGRADRIPTAPSGPGLVRRALEVERGLVAPGFSELL